MEKRNSRSHFKVELGVLKPKKSYETEKEALKIARFLNTQENIIHKMIAYKCSTCGKWHIGNNGSELTEEDRLHYKKLLQRERKWGF
jgi:hypothetical protein